MKKQISTGRPANQIASPRKHSENHQPKSPLFWGLRRAFLFILLPFFSFGQDQQVIDSLKGQVKTLHATSQRSYSEDTTLVNALNTLAWELIYSDPDTAITLSTQALELAKVVVGEQSDLSNPLGLEAQKDLANSYRNLGAFSAIKADYSQALQYFQKSLDLEKMLNHKKGIAAILGNIGIVYDKQGDYSKAREYYFKALKMDEELGNKNGIARHLGNIGIIYKNQAEYPKALEYFFKTLRMDEELRDKRGIAITLGNIGLTYMYQGDYPKALEYFFKGLKMAKELGDNSAIARNLGNIGIVYDNQNNYPKALEYYFKSLRMKEELGNKSGIARTLGNIGELYLKLYEKNKVGLFLKEGGHYNIPHHALLDSAVASQQKAFSIRKEIGDKLGITISLNNIGNILVKKEKITEALPYFWRSYALADTIGALAQKMLSAEHLYSIYKKLGNADSALAWHERFTTHKDSIFNEEKEKDLGRLEAKAEYDKQQAITEAQHQAELDKKEAIAVADSKRQNIITGSVSGGLGLVILFSIFLFNRFRITRRQKNIIEKQKEEVQQQKEVVEEKNKEISDSINYARRIQEAILPSIASLNRQLKNGFVLFKPKDVVSGDFYWLENYDNKVYFAAADCTGHGVPGAMVSVVCSHALSKSLIEESITEPAKILDRTRELVIERFAKSEEEVKDGMDISLCALNLKTKQLEWAGANNPLWIINPARQEWPESCTRYGKLEGGAEIKADKQPIGKYAGEKPFTNHKIQLQEGDVIYTFSDGYPDQFGGEKGKKFKSKNFKELLLSIQDKNMEDQKQIIDGAFEQWKGNLEQVDDVCIIGVRI